jgi:hypothetical protein
VTTKLKELLLVLRRGGFFFGGGYLQFFEGRGEFGMGKKKEK